MVVAEQQHPGGHGPLPGRKLAGENETLTEAVHRKLAQEMGFDTAVAEALAFTYRAADADSGLTDNSNADVTSFQFTVGSNPISVSAIGFWDENGDGLDATHDVGIYRQSDRVNLVTAIVPSGVAAPLEDQFRYVSIAPTILDAGESYQVVGYRARGTLDPVGFNFPTCIIRSFC